MCQGLLWWLRRYRICLGQDGPEEGMAPHSSILAWRIPGTEQAESNLLDLLLMEIQGEEAHGIVGGTERERKMNE